MCWSGSNIRASARSVYVAVAEEGQGSEAKQTKFIYVNGVYLHPLKLTKSFASLSFVQDTLL